MATYNSSNYTNNKPMPYHGQANNMQVLLDSGNVPIVAAPTTADVINYGYLPPNAVVMTGMLLNSDMDSGGSPSLTWDVGITGTPQLFFAASTGGETGTVDPTLAPAGRAYKTTAKTLVVGAPHANPATGVAGTSRIILTGYIQDPTTTGV